MIHRIAFLSGPRDSVMTRNATRPFDGAFATATDQAANVGACWRMVVSALQTFTAGRLIRMDPQSPEKEESNGYGILVKNANNLIPVVCATMTRRPNAPRRLTFRTVPNRTARAPHLSWKVVHRPGRQKSNPEPAQFCAETTAIKPRAF